MYVRKNLRKIVIASVVGSSFVFVPSVYNLPLTPISKVYAEIQFCTASAEDYANQIENQEIAKLRAKDKAIKKAVEQAGVALKSYTRTINGVLTDDEISAIASNTYTLVGEPQYTKSVNQITDESIVIIWTATVQVNVDDAEVKKWISRDDKEKSTIVAQNKESQRAFAENNQQVEDLRKRAENATTAEDKNALKAEFDKVDSEFLYNQKLEEGTRLLYKSKSREAIKCYDEAIQIDPNKSPAYNWRGNAYCQVATINKFIEHNSKAFSDDYNKAVADYNKAIQLDPNYSDAYSNRGFIYYVLASDNKKAFDDFNKAIQLDPNNVQAYVYRSLYYRQVLKNNDLALKDLNKALEINPNYVHGYVNRGIFYRYDLKDSRKALEDFTKAIEIDPNNAIAYHNRGDLYADLKEYDNAITDFDKAIELESNDDMKAMNYYSRGNIFYKLKNYNKAIEDFTNFIELAQVGSSAKILLPYVYKNRGECYKAIGDNAKAQADFAKSK